MRYHRTLAFSLLVIFCAVAAGKNKKKIILPKEVLEARTVLVMVDPDAGIPVEAPNANRTAQEDVEKALMNWDRQSVASLLTIVRSFLNPLIQEWDWGQRGNPQPGDLTGGQPENPHPQIEVAPTQDMFAVYRGKRDNALDSPTVYSTKDALRSPDVPAVDVFRNLIKEAEKQQSATP